MYESGMVGVETEQMLMECCVVDLERSCVAKKVCSCVLSVDGDLGSMRTAQDSAMSRKYNHQVLLR